MIGEPLVADVLLKGFSWCVARHSTDDCCAHPSSVDYLNNVVWILCLQCIILPLHPDSNLTDHCRIAAWSPWKGEPRGFLNLRGSFHFTIQLTNLLNRILDRRTSEKLCELVIDSQMYVRPSDARDNPRIFVSWVRPTVKLSATHFRLDFKPR